jgi:hypothetical protein
MHMHALAGSRSDLEGAITAFLCPSSRSALLCALQPGRARARIFVLGGIQETKAARGHALEARVRPLSDPRPPRKPPIQVSDSLTTSLSSFSSLSSREKLITIGFHCTQIQ